MTGPPPTHSEKMIDAGFERWLRAVINPQADPAHGNSVALDDFSKDGMTEYAYPKEFTVHGDLYQWTASSAHTKGRHLCTHYEIWFYGPAFGPGRRISTGGPTKAKIRRGLRVIYQFYREEPL